MKTADEIIWRIVDDEVLLLNTKTGHYFSMNGTATEIWCLLNEGKSALETSKVLAERYDIDFAAAQADVSELCETLTTESIATI